MGTESTIVINQTRILYLILNVKTISVGKPLSFALLNSYRTSYNCQKLFTVIPSDYYKKFLNVSKLVSLIIIHKSKIINHLVNCRHLHDITTNFSLRLLADKAINRGLRN